MTFKVDDLPDLSGKVFIITGGTAGLGLASAVALISKGAQVIISARNDERGKTAVEEIKKQVKKDEVKLSYGVMDQGDLKSVKSFANWFLSLNLPLHSLLLNAGVFGVPFKLIDGVESHFYIDHLSHFYLANLLINKLEESAPSRITFVSSDAHKHFTKEVPDWEKLSTFKYEGLTQAMKMYGYAKLANIQNAITLSKKLQGKKIWVNAIHPGGVNTNGASKIPFSSTFFGKILNGAISLILTSPKNGALTQIYVAAHPDIETKDIRGRYFVPTAQLKDPNSLATDEKTQEELWNLSEKLVKNIMGE